MVGRAHRNSPVSASSVQTHAGLAGDAGQHLARLAGAEVGIDPRHRGRIRRHFRAHDHALEGVVEIPTVARQVLEVPRHLPGIGIERQRGVRVEEIDVVYPLELFRQRPGWSGAPEDQVVLRVVAAHHPGRSGRAGRQRDAAPGVAARLVRRGRGVDAPELLAGLDVVGRDEAAAGQRARRMAARSGDQLAADHQRSVGLR